MLRTTVVIPCFNEASRLDAAELRRYLRADALTRFVLVNDGSTDGTLELLHDIAASAPDRVGVLDQQPNAGKAAAVRVGLIRALEDDDCNAVGYWDADLATPLSDIATLRAVLEAEPHVDIVLGSRVQLLGRLIERRPARHYAGRVFATFASLLLRMPVYDTQCGAKLFRANGSLRAALETPFATRWVFDVELLRRLVITRREAGELPVEEATHEVPLLRWRDVAGSKVRPTDFPRALGDLARIAATYGDRGFR